MEEDKKVVETSAETATAQTEVSTVSDTEVDLSARLTETEAELVKVKEERENYKKGLLKAKGKLPDEDETTHQDETTEELIERKVNERFLSTKESQLQAQRDADLKAIIKRNKELELALKSKTASGQVAGQGSNQDKAEVKTDTFFSDEQLKSLKARGLDPEKVKANMLKAQTSPGIKG